MKKDFRKWFFEIWNTQNGLIRKKDAADLMGISKQAINERIKSGSVPEYAFTDENGERHSFVGMKDILQISIREKGKRQAKKEAEPKPEAEPEAKEEKDKKEEPQSSFPGPQAVLPEN